ncbi:type II toxin-antitoxin system RelE/ParE family toxin [Propionimicrobium sp. PCR01-08-3]|uniref:type II toxin-antitoxin system RelE/ParE family toxin n=1 Tax=Propionimicrobium sp. PCR01-08-3 TaxID=3052086 RepID=UPI00333E2765
MHPEAETEYSALDAREAVAVDNAIAKLANAGPQLPYPHSSAVRGARRLRELRPRGGRSVTRALYRQIGNVLVIGAFAPEVESDVKGFRKACGLAERRLDEVEE